jgi:hypothetical protein
LAGHVSRKYLLIFIFLILASCTKSNWSDRWIIQDLKEYKSINKLTEVQVFKRCYQLMTRLPIEHNKSLLDRVKSKELSGAKACGLLIDAVTLDSNGKLKHNESISEKEAKSIFETFYLLHSRWFKAFDFAFTNINWGTGEFLDFNQMGMNYQYVFLRNEPYRNLLKGNRFFRTDRSSTFKNEFLLYRDDGNKPIMWKDLKQVYGTKSKGTSPLKKDLLPAPRGEIQGIFINQNEDKIEKLFIDHKDEFISTNDSFYQNIGGGVIGSSPYVLLNYGQSFGEIMNGNIKTPRRWSKAILNDLLCRDLPAILEKDAETKVKKNSHIAYEKSAKCISCHLTMDPMAGVLKEYQVGINNTIGAVLDDKGIIDRQEVIFSFIHKLKGDELKKLSNYNSENNGKIYLRDFKGAIIDVKTDNMNELGKELASLDDFYLCAAKRYFYFFTGINIQTDPIKLLKFKEPKSPELSYVYKWALNLKKHQNLKQLMKDIFKSPSFRDRRYKLQGIE